MNNPSGPDYALILRDIDAIATQLQRLQSAGIPVLWRPLHEAEGTWFWWGAKGASAYKKLYSLLYSRLTDFHQLNNLIWVWNSLSSDWYPGPDAVDIVSADMYAEPGNHSTQAAIYAQLRTVSADAKIIALTECGAIPDPHLMAQQGVWWAWWLVWAGDFIADGKTNSRSFLRSTYRSQHVLTIEELTGWKNGTTASGGVAPWGQCGGQGWANATSQTTCAQGSTCKYVNQWYSQCVPR